MDGWGLGKNKHSDAIQHANVPFVKSLYSKYPNSKLVTCGEAVGASRHMERARLAEFANA